MALCHTRPFEGHAFDESPWYAPLMGLLARFREHTRFPTPEELSALYAERTRHVAVEPLRFVPSPPKKPKKRKVRRAPVTLASLYEGRIVEAHEVPTRRDDWHDFFNALAFCAFPRAKWALHARQYRIYQGRVTPETTRLPGARTREQDALALFDEGGLVLCVADVDRPRIPDDPELFDHALTELVREGRARAVPFGHALYEHIVAGLPPPLAYGHVITLDTLSEVTNERAWDAELTRIDAALAQSLADPREFQAPHRARGLSLAALGGPMAA